MLFKESKESSFIGYILKEKCRRHSFVKKPTLNIPRMFFDPRTFFVWEQVGIGFVRGLDLRVDVQGL